MIRKTNLKSIESVSKGLSNNLDDLLKDLPFDKELSAGDIKSLVVQYIIETKDDTRDIKGHRSKLRLEALRLLADLTKLEAKTNNTDADILSIIGAKKDEEE